MNTYPNPYNFCDECAENSDAIVNCEDYPCDECWPKVPEHVSDTWERREKRERQEYSRWLHEL